MTSETFYAGKRSDEWQTPQELFERLNKQYKFKVDLAASKDNSKCEVFFSKENSYLDNRIPYGDPNCWLNPPFSKAYEFFEKVSKDFTPIDRDSWQGAVAIYKSSNMEASVWQDVILKQASWVLILKKRTNYTDPEQPDRDSAPFGSSIIGFNVSYPENHQELGTLIDLKKGRV